MRGFPGSRNCSWLLGLVVWEMIIVFTPAAGADETKIHPTTRPAMVYVADFQVDLGNVQMQPRLLTGQRLGGRLRERMDLSIFERYDSPQELADHVVQVFATTVVNDLSKAGVPAMRLQPGALLPRNGWLMSGQFHKIDEGNQAVRAMVGFGAGEPKLEVAGDVADLSHTPPGSFFLFGDENDARKRPGALILMNPYVMAAKYVLSSHATEKDVKQLASKVASELVTYMQNNGILPPKN